jgi:hypothetical protein
MRRVKRTAISLRPKQPYIQWANGLDEDGVKIGIDFTPEENGYLLPDNEVQQYDLETLMTPYYQTIFEEELGSWHRVEANWPARRDLPTFFAWFEVETHSMVLDVVGGWLRSERYERY